MTVYAMQRSTSSSNNNQLHKYTYTLRELQALLNFNTKLSPNMVFFREQFLWMDFLSSKFESTFWISL